MQEALAAEQGDDTAAYTAVAPFARMLQAALEPLLLLPPPVALLGSAHTGRAAVVRPGAPSAAAVAANLPLIRKVGWAGLGWVVE